MIHRLFGDSIDIHMGGIDLLFPHHENEIAQSECATGRPLAAYWVHNGLLEINAEKMSKSLGNIIRTHEFIEKYGSELFRLLVFSFHYRSPIDFSDDNIHRTELMLQKLYKACEEARGAHEDTLPAELPGELLDLKAKIEEALFDDFHSARAFGLVMSGLRTCYRENKPAFWKAWGVCIPVLQNVFGILNESPPAALDDIRQRKLKRTGISEARAREIESKIEERLLYRQQKNFEKADQIRAALEGDGILVMDSSEGSSWGVKEK
jgi:cysteinyl-tRNA synthetase